VTLLVSAEASHEVDIVRLGRNFGSVAMSGALLLDPGIAALARNTLHHFGVERVQAGQEAASDVGSDDPAEAFVAAPAFAGDAATQEATG
jgi:hypothetical protein